MPSESRTACETNQKLCLDWELWYLFLIEEAFAREDVYFKNTGATFNKAIL